VKIEFAMGEVGVFPLMHGRVEDAITDGMVFATFTHTPAAELAGATLSANITSLEGIGKPFELKTKLATAPWQRLDYQLPDGRYLGVMAKDGIIMHLELVAYLGREAPSGVKDLIFSKSSLADIHAAMGSKGFTFNQTAVIKGPDHLFLNCSYRLEGDQTGILSFVTMTQKDMSTLEPASPEAASAALLIGVMLSNAAYLDTTLGQKTFSDGEKPVVLP
jgi:hypothetical protein